MSTSIKSDRRLHDCGDNETDGGNPSPSCMSNNLRVIQLKGTGK